jgi:hypothetical protein
MSQSATEINPEDVGIFKDENGEYYTQRSECRDYCYNNNFNNCVVMMDENWKWCRIDKNGKIDYGITSQSGIHTTFFDCGSKVVIGVNCDVCRSTEIITLAALEHTHRVKIIDKDDNGFYRNRLIFLNNGDPSKKHDTAKEYCQQINDKEVQFGNEYYCSNCSCYLYDEEYDNDDDGYDDVWESACDFRRTRSSM